MSSYWMKMRRKLQGLGMSVKPEGGGSSKLAPSFSSPRHPPRLGQVWEEAVLVLEQEGCFLCFRKVSKIKIRSKWLFTR